MFARSMCALAVLLAPVARAACVGDCNGDGSVAVSDLILGVSIVLGSAPLAQCPSLDANANGSVAIDELVSAVNAALSGCVAGSTPTPSASRTASPTLTETPAIGPQVLFFGVASADDTLQPPTATQPDGTTVYQRSFGFGFRLVVEAARGGSRLPLGSASFDVGRAPDLQVQVTRPLGNGSAAVCDNAAPNFGGVPAIDPPRFEDRPEVVDALNDLGCRFLDGTGEPSGRSCAASCIREGANDYACQNQDTDLQFCALVDSPLEFPAGDTLVTVRVRDNGGNLGKAARLIVRIQP